MRQELFSIKLLINTNNKQYLLNDKYNNFLNIYNQFINNNNKKNLYDKLEILLINILELKININYNLETNIKFIFHINIIQDLINYKIKNIWDIIILYEQELIKYKKKDDNLELYEYFNNCLLIYRKEKLYEIQKNYNLNKIIDLPKILIFLDKHVEKMRICFLLDIKKPVKEFSEIITLKRNALYFIKKYIFEIKYKITDEEYLLLKKTSDIEKISVDIYLKLDKNMQCELRNIAINILKKDEELYDNIIITEEDILKLIKSLMVFICKFLIIIKTDDNNNKIKDVLDNYLINIKIPIKSFNNIKNNYKGKFMRVGREMMFKERIDIKLSKNLLEKIDSMMKYLINNIENIFKRVNEEIDDIETYLKIIYNLINKKSKKNNKKDKNNKKTYIMTIEEKEIFEKKFENLMNQLKNSYEEIEENEEEIKNTMLELKEIHKQKKIQNNSKK